MANLQEIPGLTDDTKPRRLGPKRASKIRKLFMLSKEDDVRQYVIKRPLPAKVCYILVDLSLGINYEILSSDISLQEGKENKKQRYKAPKIQRLVTPAMLQRKRHRLALKRRRAEKNRQASVNFSSHSCISERLVNAQEAQLWIVLYSMP